MARLYMTTYEFCRQIRINLSAGNINDSVLFERQIASFQLTWQIVHNIIEILSANGAVICIPTKSNMQYILNYDKTQYMARNKIERLFKRLKDNKRIATRYDGLDSLFLSSIYFSAILFLIPLKDQYYNRVISKLRICIEHIIKCFRLRYCSRHKI